MRMMVIYTSQYGNTEQVARAIGGILQQHGEVAVVRVGEVRADQLKGMDLVVVGSPTQQFRATEDMRTFLKNIPRDGLKGIKTAAFDTRLTQAFMNQHPPLGFVERIFGYAAQRIARALHEKGGELVLPAEGFFVEDTPGPLVQGELERAEHWAETLFA